MCGLIFSAESLGIKKSHLWKLLSVEVLIVLLSFNPNVKSNAKPLKNICMVMEDVSLDLMRVGQTHKCKNNLVISFIDYIYIFFQTEY